MTHCSSLTGEGVLCSDMLHETALATRISTLGWRLLDRDWPIRHSHPAILKSNVSNCLSPSSFSRSTDETRFSTPDPRVVLCLFPAHFFSKVFLALTWSPDPRPARPRHFKAANPTTDKHFLPLTWCLSLSLFLSTLLSLSSLHSSSSSLSLQQPRIKHRAACC